MLMQRQAVGEGAGWPQVTKHKAPLPRDLLAGLAHQPGAGRRQIEGRLPASTEGSISQKSCPTIGSEDPAQRGLLALLPKLSRPQVEGARTIRMGMGIQPHATYSSSPQQKYPRD